MIRGVYKPADKEVLYRSPKFVKYAEVMEKLILKKILKLFVSCLDMGATSDVVPVTVTSLRH